MSFLIWLHFGGYKVLECTRERHWISDMALHRGCWVSPGIWWNIIIIWDIAGLSQRWSAMKHPRVLCLHEVNTIDMGSLQDRCWMRCLWFYSVATILSRWSFWIEVGSEGTCAMDWCGCLERDVSCILVIWCCIELCSCCTFTEHSGWEEVPADIPIFHYKNWTIHCTHYIVFFVWLLGPCLICYSQ